MMQIQIKAAVADRHHVDPPGRVGLTVHLHTNRHRLAPAGLQQIGCLGTDEDVGVYASDLDRGTEPGDGQVTPRFHRTLLRPGTRIRSR